MIRRSLQKHHDVQLTPNPSMDATIMKLTAALLLLSAHLSLGLSTYFLNWLTLLRVCSASSLDGSMMRALGALELDLTWLTLALPEDKYTWQTECKEPLIQALQAVKNECGLKLTCLAGFDHMTVWSLVQGHISIFRLVFERFITEVEFQFSILGLIDINMHFKKSCFEREMLHSNNKLCICQIPSAHRKQRRAGFSSVEGSQKPDPDHYLWNTNRNQL